MRWPRRIYINPFFRAMCGRSSERHIFVIGPPRSGTTLLSNIISNHSNICAYGGETNLFSWRTCFFLFEGCADRHSAAFHDFRSDCRDVVELMDRLASQLKARTGTTRFLEKTPQHALHIGFMIDKFPNAKIINIIRDPRDGFVSSRSNPHVPQTTPGQFARYWLRCVASRANIGGHRSILDLKYEELVSMPEQQIIRVMKHIGEPFEHNQLDPNKMSCNPRANTPEFRLLGGPVSSRSVGRWRIELTKQREKSSSGRQCP